LYIVLFRLFLPVSIKKNSNAPVGSRIAGSTESTNMLILFRWGGRFACPNTFAVRCKAGADCREPHVRSAAHADV